MTGSVICYCGCAAQYNGSSRRTGTRCTVSRHTLTTRASSWIAHYMATTTNYFKGRAKTRIAPCLLGLPIPRWALEQHDAKFGRPAGGSAFDQLYSDAALRRPMLLLRRQVSRLPAVDFRFRLDRFALQYVIEKAAGLAALEKARSLQRRNAFAATSLLDWIGAGLEWYTESESRLVWWEL